MTTEKCDMRVVPSFKQAWNEEGSYDFVAGHTIEARVPQDNGDAIYTFQAVFATADEAESKLGRMSGSLDGLNSDIDTESDQWLFTGASY